MPSRTDVKPISLVMSIEQWSRERRLSLSILSWHICHCPMISSSCELLLGSSFVFVTLPGPKINYMSSSRTISSYVILSHSSSFCRNLASASSLVVREDYKTTKSRPRLLRLLRTRRLLVPSNINTSSNNTPNKQYAQYSHTQHGSPN